jgi:HTH-type transcriptional regulator, sugar sensing transcriptional regulator
VTIGTLIPHLEDLGFTLNEARAYAALLQRGASTGYEVGQHAGIPRSAVYGVLRKLVQTGAARSMAARDGEPERFVATPPEGVIALLKKRFDASAGALEEAAQRLDTTPDSPDVYGVRGYLRVMEEAERLVVTAKTQLVISGWPRELAQLAPELRKAHKRKVYVVIFSHAALPDDLPGQVFSYGVAESDLEAFWKHRLVVVSDDARTLVGATEQGVQDGAVVSATAAIAELATSQIALDITLLAQRQKEDVEPVMAKMLGHRVGSLDALLARKSGKKRPPA